MSEKEKDLEAGLVGLEQPVTENTRERSPGGSSRTVFTNDDKTAPSSRRHQNSEPKDEEKITETRKSSDGSSTDINHGEPDQDHEEVEDIIPGHDLDRQLSRVHDIESIRRIETHTTVRSKISKVFSRRNTQKEGLKRARIPETDLDAGIVGWDSQDDPNMPLNFAASKKWLLVSLLSAITLVTPFASSILSPGITDVMAEFHETNAIVGAMSVSIYLMGYVVGPMFLAPMSEIYGRRPILTGANIFFSGMQIGCALAPNMAALIVLRFFSGVGGSGCMTMGGGLIADMFRPEQRGLAMGIWALGPMFGPSIGPLIGGFVAETIGWRWDFWIVLIMAIVISITMEILNQETSHHILIEKKVARLQKELGRDDLKSCYDTPGAEKRTLGQVLLTNLIRPIKLLFLSPIVLLLSIYISFAYGTLYLLFTTIPTVFGDTYGFNVGVSGIVYLGLGAGMIIGWGYLTLYSDKKVITLAKKNNGEFEPEMRLYLSIFFSWLLPITFFWYGWCTEYKVHWISPILSLIPFGIGIMGLFLPIQTYLVDCYPTYAASAMAANTELRSLVGALLPLAGSPLYDTLGQGWGNSLLGFICILMIPLPIFFYRFGKRLRKMEKFTL